MSEAFEFLVQSIEALAPYRSRGKVRDVVGLVVEVSSVDTESTIGDRVAIVRPRRPVTVAEVVGFRCDGILAIPFGDTDGIGPGCPVDLGLGEAVLHPDAAWLGRVIDALGEPIDGRGPLPRGVRAYAYRRPPPLAAQRQRLGGKIDLGVRALNTFATCCQGQRLGIFAGSGVGKSSLLSMVVRHSNADVCVLGLVGERGREARDFIEDDLGAAGMARSVVVVSTSDEAPTRRRLAAHTTLSVAEYFRDQGCQVLCLIDSVTRFAMAQREVSLAAGEPPVSKGYTPSVFAELPRLLERAGPGLEGQGSITGLFTVLVDGDDHNEPISDAVRSILDGHIVLDRRIADRGRYPAIDVLRTVSRSLPGCNSETENALLRRARQVLSVYDDMAELIRLGAYQAGSSPEVDEAIALFPALDAYLQQGKDEPTTLAEGYGQLAAILDSAKPASEVRHGH